MRYFIDTEFFEDGETIDLISIGIVAEDGRELYAVSRESRLYRANDWVRTHVLPQLPKYDDPAWMPRAAIANALVLFTGGAIQTSGLWVTNADLVPSGVVDKTPLEFWGYYADYDWVAVCQLFGTMMKLPERFPKFCRDLKQLSVDVGSPEHPPDPKDEHNALADARWNRDLYAFLMEHKAKDDAVEIAWGIIANAHGGRWEDASPEWRQAAERWRDQHITRRAR